MFLNTLYPKVRPSYSQTKLRTKRQPQGRVDVASWCRFVSLRAPSDNLTMFTEMRKCSFLLSFPSNRIGAKRRRTSDVRGNVRAGCRHSPRVAVPCRCDQSASPDRLRASRYSFPVDVCIVSLISLCQEKVSRACLSVMLKCNVCWPNGSY